MVRALPPEKVALAMERIRCWSAAPETRVPCPVCEAAGLEIADRSSRPYAEWYVLSCATCGLEATISVPLAPPLPF